MGNMILHTIAFVVVNVIIALILSSAQGVDVRYSQEDVSISDNVTAATWEAGTVKDVGNYAVSDDELTQSGVPTWFKWILLLIDSIWLVGIIAGWVRGTS